MECNGRVDEGGLNEGRGEGVNKGVGEWVNEAWMKR